MITEDVILEDDPRAAEYRTDAHGWVSRQGYYFGTHPKSEEIARRHGATHIKCAGCGIIMDKSHYPLCRGCTAKKERQKYEAMPKKEWDGKAMLYSMRDNEYFTDIDCVMDYLDGDDINDLMLVICQPIKLRMLDDDFFEEDFQEDDIPAHLKNAIASFNEAVKNCPDVPFEPGGFALDIREIAERASK